MADYGIKRWRSSNTAKSFLQIKEGDIIAFCDTETTGLNSAGEDVTIQFSGQKMRMGQDGNLEFLSEICVYINPRRPLPEKIVEVTGITDTFLWGFPGEDIQFPLIKEFLSDADVFACYNEPFDYGFVKAMYERQGERFEPKLRFDVLAMVHDVITMYQCKIKKLGKVGEYLGIKVDGNLHNASTDVAMMIEVFKKLYPRYKDYATEKVAQSLGTKKIQIYSSWYWENPNANKMQRIYFSTPYGKIFFEKFDRSWGAEDSDINMEFAEATILSFLGLSSPEELSHFKEGEYCSLCEKRGIRIWKKN